MSAKLRKAKELHLVLSGGEGNAQVQDGSRPSKTIMGPPKRPDAKRRSLQVERSSSSGRESDSSEGSVNSRMELAAAKAKRLETIRRIRNADKQREATRRKIEDLTRRRQEVSGGKDLPTDVGRKPSVRRVPPFKEEEPQKLGSQVKKSLARKTPLEQKEEELQKALAKMKMLEDKVLLLTSESESERSRSRSESMDSQRSDWKDWRDPHGAEEITYKTPIPRAVGTSIHLYKEREPVESFTPFYGVQEPVDPPVPSDRLDKGDSYAKEEKEKYCDGTPNVSKVASIVKEARHRVTLTNASVWQKYLYKIQCIITEQMWDMELINVEKTWDPEAPETKKQRKHRFELFKVIEGTLGIRNTLGS